MLRGEPVVAGRDRDLLLFGQRPAEARAARNPAQPPAAAVQIEHQHPHRAGRPVEPDRQALERKLLGGHAGGRHRIDLPAVAHLFQQRAVPGDRFADRLRLQFRQTRRHTGQKSLSFRVKFTRRQRQGGHGRQTETDQFFYHCSTRKL